MHRQVRMLIHRFKHILSSAAIRAFPIVWQLFKRSADRNAILRITYRWIINITADSAFPFLHRRTSVLVK